MALPFLYSFKTHNMVSFFVSLKFAYNPNYFLVVFSFLSSILFFLKSLQHCNCEVLFVSSYSPFRSMYCTFVQLFHKFSDIFIGDIVRSFFCLASSLQPSVYFCAIHPRLFLSNITGTAVLPFLRICSKFPVVSHSLLRNTYSSVVLIGT